MPNEPEVYVLPLRQLQKPLPFVPSDDLLPWDNFNDLKRELACINHELSLLRHGFRLELGLILVAETRPREQLKTTLLHHDPMLHQVACRADIVVTRDGDVVKNRFGHTSDKAVEQRVNERFEELGIDF